MANNKKDNLLHSNGQTSDMVTVSLTSTAAVNGNTVPVPKVAPPPVPSAKGSPSPSSKGSPLPSGKGSPYVERSNPMGGGAAQTVTSRDPKAAAQAATDMRNVVRRKLTGYVGFANLPNQWHRKSVRKGFNFNVMVVGTCGIPYC